MPPDLSKVKLLCKITHGSRLYRLHSDSSDYDEKGLFLPSSDDCLLNRAAKNITWKEPEVNKESELFSLTEFFKHASRAEGYSIDMLHCADTDVIQTSDVFEYLRAHKSKFYTKEMVGLLGFCRTQSFKYAIKSERLNAVKEVLAVLKQAESDGAAKLYQIWDKFPQNHPHIHFGIEERSNQKDNRYIEVAGRKLTATISITYGIPILENLVSSFGNRVKAAAELDEKDLKSLSHSFRTGFVLRQIYLNGDFSYPLPETKFLRDVKFRTFDYSVDKLDGQLDELVNQVEELAAKSSFPTKVNQKWLDEVVLAAYCKMPEFFSDK